MLGFSVLDDQWIKRLQNFSRPKFGSDMNSKGLAGIFIHHRQYLVWSAVAKLVVNKIYCPYVIGIFRTQPNNRCILVIKPFALFVTGWKLQAFFAPQPLDFLVINVPSLST